MYDKLQIDGSVFHGGGFVQTEKSRFEIYFVILILMQKREISLFK
jgi:hypothetical protein